MHEELQIEVSAVTLSFQLHPSLSIVLEEPSFHETLRQALKQRLTEVMAIFNIPGKPDIDMLALISENVSPSKDLVLRIFVNGHECSYTFAVLAHVYYYVNSLPLDMNMTEDSLDILAWLQQLSNDRTQPVYRQRLVDFFSLAALETMKRQPMVLLGRDSVAAYIASLPTPTSEAHLQQANVFPDPDWLLPVLCKVLQLKFPLADTQAVANVLCTMEGHTQGDAAEALINALHSDVIEIQLSQEYLQQITISDRGVGARAFMRMREILFQKSGLRYPTFRFVPVENLQPFHFTFKINHVTTLSWVGLQIHPSIEKKTSTHPLTKIKGIFNLLHTQQEVSYPLALKQMMYMQQCLAKELIENNASFLCQQEVQERLKALARVYPELVKAIQATFSTEQVTSILRALVIQGISIHNLRFILERMLDYDYVLTEPSNSITFSDYLAVHTRQDGGELNELTAVVAFIREGLNYHIKHM